LKEEEEKKTIKPMAFIQTYRNQTNKSDHKDNKNISYINHTLSICLAPVSTTPLVAFLTVS
jgi:hypothetical protein